MSPDQLLQWEGVLRSQYAVSLLLLAALLAMTAWAFKLYRDNQQLNREFREHLKVQGDFGGVMDHVREALSVVREARETTGGETARTT